MRHCDAGKAANKAEARYLRGASQCSSDRQKYEGHANYLGRSVGSDSCRSQPRL